MTQRIAVTGLRCHAKRMMADTNLRINSRELCFVAQLERELAPRTCAYIDALLPYTQKLIHVRWSGEACWIPLGDQSVPFPFENATSHPAPGQMLFYPGGYSETELLLAYGSACFSSKMGQLAGNHFLTIIDNSSALVELGRRAVWQGAQEVRIERCG